MFRAPLLKSIPIRSNDFAMEPEITAKIAKRECRIFEVPISYLGRTYREGKKIGWKDGFKALRAMLKYWLVDDLYAEDEYGSHILHSLERAQRFNRWMADTHRARTSAPGCWRSAPASATSPPGCCRATSTWRATSTRTTCTTCATSSLGKPYLAGRPHRPRGRRLLRAAGRGRFDTVVCLNVLEHVRDPLQSLRNIHERAAARAAGWCSTCRRGSTSIRRLDEVLGHRCRYDREMLRRELRDDRLRGRAVPRLQPLRGAGLVAERQDPQAAALQPLAAQDLQHDGAGAPPPRPAGPRQGPGDHRRRHPARVSAP